MTVSVTHAQQLTITTSTSNPVMPLTMLQQTSTGTATSTSLTSSPNYCTNNESTATNYNLHSSIHSNNGGYMATNGSATTTSSFITSSAIVSSSSAKATTVLAPPLVATTTTTIAPTATTNTSSPSSSTSSSSTTALRRLYFKTGRNAAKTRQASAVPKVVVMGSSSTSEATINTSTESASTLVTNITATTDTDTTADSLDLGDTSGQSEPLLSSSLDDNPLTSITSESDSLEKDEIQSIVTVAEGNIKNHHRDNDSSSSPLINYEDITLHPYKTPQTAPLVTSTRFQFDPPQSPKSVRTFNEKNQTHFTFDDLKFKLKSKSSVHHSSSSSENLKLNRIRSHKMTKSKIHNQGIDDDDDDDAIDGGTCGRIMSTYRSSFSGVCGGTGGSEKKLKNSTMFPFDREAIDYERIQRECFACEDESESNGESNLYYESGKNSSLPPKHHADDRNYYSDDIRSPSEIFYQYTLLSQEEYEEKTAQQSLNNQRRSQKYHGKSYRKAKNRSDRYSEHGIVSPSLPGSQQLNGNGGGQSSNTPPLPDLRIDYFTELANTNNSNNSRNHNNNTSTSSSTSSSQHDDLLATCQKYTNNNNNCTSNSGGVGIGGCGSGPINVTPNPMDTAVYTQPRATIVVQQASLSLDNSVETYLLKNEGDFISVEQGKELRKKKQREENMRQLLDVTNTFTSEEIRDFEMRYGSPHHSRSQSVKTPGSRASGRPNQLTLPQQRSRVASMPNTGVEEEYYRLRHFSITGKGVINRGDSLKSRRSRSNNSVASSNSSTEHLTAIPAQQPSQNVSASGSVKTSAACSLASSRESSTSNPAPAPYKVLMLGGAAVGKSSLVSQFMTSEYLHAYDTSIDDDTGEKSVSVLLSGEESELIFIDHPHSEMMPENCIATYDPHGYCVIYSSADRSSFVLAEKILQTLWTSENIAQKAVILVGNKADLARSRVVTPEEGKSMATAYDCKFIETSVGINHNVDELLVGILSQIRLKLENPEKSRDLFRKRSTRKSKRRACSPLGTAAACLSGNGGTNTSTPVTNIAFNDFSTPPGSAHSSPRKYRGSRTSASLKVKGLLGRVWARDSKSKSCENLHVL